MTEQWIDVQGHRLLLRSKAHISLSINDQLSPKFYLVPFPRYSFANQKPPHPSLSPWSRGPVEFRNQTWQTKSYGIGLHSSHRQIDDRRRQTTFHGNSGTLQCNCNIPLKISWLLAHSKLIAFCNNPFCYCLKESPDINPYLGVWFLLNRPVHSESKRPTIFIVHNVA